MILRWRDPNEDPPLAITFEQRAALDLPWSAGPTIVMPTLEHGDTYSAQTGIEWCAEVRARTFREDWSVYSNVVIKNCPEGEGIPPTYVTEPGFNLSLLAMIPLLWLFNRIRDRGQMT